MRTITPASDRHAASPSPVTLEEARRLIEANLAPLPAETVLLHHALGRAAAERVTAPADIPPVRNSAMDGYALPNEGSRADGYLLLEPDHPDPARLDGRTRRVLTGQPVPPWAFCVAAEEHCRLRGQVVFPQATWPEDFNIRAAGEDARQGDILIDRGRPLGAADLARAATGGRHRLRVGRRPRVRLMTTGNELVRPPARPGTAWHRYECNAVMLATLLAGEGCRADPLPHLPDRPEAVREALQGLGACDLLVTIGGASNSEADLSRPLLRELGATFLFERVHIKPGRPTAFGLWRGRPVLCLPGNPVAAFVTALLFAVPVVRRLAGFAPAPPCPFRVRFQGEILPDRKRFQFCPVRLQPADDGIPVGIPFPVTGSGILRSLTTSDALVEVPADTHVKPGSLLAVRWLGPSALP